MSSPSKTTIATVPEKFVLVEPKIKQAKTTGWVRYMGTATLYRVSDLNRWNNQWRTLFQEYNQNNAATPAGSLIYSANNPGFQATAQEGQAKRDSARHHRLDERKAVCRTLFQRMKSLTLADHA
jgi:hypothetical protein